MYFFYRIINIETQEVIEKDLSNKETDIILAEIAKAEEIAKIENAKEAARQSAIEKLAALGLTEAEIQALAG